MSCITLKTGTDYYNAGVRTGFAVAVEVAEQCGELQELMQRLSVMARCRDVSDMFLEDYSD